MASIMVNVTGATGIATITPGIEHTPNHFATAVERIVAEFICGRTAFARPIEEAEPCHNCPCSLRRLTVAAAF